MITHGNWILYHGLLMEGRRKSGLLWDLLEQHFLGVLLHPLEIHSGSGVKEARVYTLIFAPHSSIETWTNNFSFWVSVYGYVSGMDIDLTTLVSICKLDDWAISDTWNFFSYLSPPLSTLILTHLALVEFFFVVLIHWACWMSSGVRVPPVLWLVATKGVLCKAERDIGGGNFLRPSLDHQENNHSQLYCWSIWGLGLCLANGLPWFLVFVRADETQ